MISKANHYRENMHQNIKHRFVLEYTLFSYNIIIPNFVFCQYCFDIIKKYFCFRVHFQVADAMEMDYPSEHYDAVQSRDAILHMHDKPKLFKDMFNCLKPGGKLLITDYCRNTNSIVKDPKFVEYVNQFNYDMITVPEYETFLSKVGFENVVGIDNSKMFADVLKSELETLSQKDTEISIKELVGSEEYHVWCKLWKDKIQRVENGEHVWGLFTATKPMS